MGMRSLIGRGVAQMRSWFRAVSERGRVEAEMNAELADHLARLTDDLIRKGHSPDEAARRARIALGTTMTHKEEMRTSLGLGWWDKTAADLRYAARLLRKSPGFTAIAATSLALAIGANTTIFSIAKRLLLDRLNVPHPAELRLLQWSGDKNVAVHNIWGDFSNDGNNGVKSHSFSYPVYEQLRRDNRVLEDLFAFKDAGSLNATIDGTAQVVQGQLVSGNYFEQLGISAQLGRTIGESDDRAGAAPVAVISSGLWQRSLGSSPDVIGRVIRVNMTPVTIIGVTPRDFTGAVSVQAMPDLFLPMSLQPQLMPRGRDGSLLGGDAHVWWLNIMGRVRPDVKPVQAQVALSVSFEAAVRATLKPGTHDTMPHLALLDGSRGLFNSEETFAKPLAVLSGVVGMVLLLACANIASLMLARATSRQREISVRLALGAGRVRILRQVLTESLLLSGVGGAFGLGLAFYARKALPALLANPWENSSFVIPFDWAIFAFTAGVTLLTGLVFGVVPAWAATRTEVCSGLKEQSQSTTRRRKGLGGKAIVAFQMAISTILVAGALLFVRTLMNLARIDPGFRTDHLLLFALAQPNSRYPHPAEIGLFQRIEERLRALPGVEAVTVAEAPYLSDSMENAQFLPEGEKADENKDQSAFDNNVGPGFFHTIGVPILAGREFNANDTTASTHVAVVSEILARQAFPGQNPIGKHFTSHSHPEEGKPGVSIQIVGVCGDIRYSNVKNDPVGMFYEPYSQATNLSDGVTYEIRTRTSPAAMAPTIRSVVQAVDPDLPLIDLRTQQEQIDATTQNERIFATLTAGFGILALALACVGVYGVMAYSVARRTSEIGIRLALGALPRQVLAMVLREASWLGVIGIGAGLGAALLLTRLVKSLLYGLEPADPISLSGAVAFLVAVGLAASWIPARRAAGVQPIKALRHE